MSLERSLRSVLARGIETRATPGAVAVVVAGDRVVAEIAAGETASPDDGGAPVDADTIYDLASLTKPLATWALAVRAIGRGALSTETPVRSVLGDRVSPAWDAICAGHLLGHSAGLPAHLDYYLELRDLEISRARARLIEKVTAEAPVDRPGVRAVYSDLGYIALGAILESIDGRRLDRQLADVTGPLSMTATGFRPIGETKPADPASVAPTERDDHRGLVIGEVHDENAHAAGGVCGHAGLFGTAGDVARFAVEVMAAARGGGGGIFDPAVVAELVATPSAPGAGWRLGWDTPSPPPARSHAGDLWPRTGIGHLGFTGTSLWLDPPSGAAVVLLTNRVYFGRDPEPIRELRREVMDTARRWIVKSS